MRFWLPLIATASLSACLGPARAEDPEALAAMFPFGRDFCFIRRYTPAHMQRHTRQRVRAIAIMGRNAHRTEAAAEATENVNSSNVHAALRIELRSGRVREWPGTCHLSDHPDYKTHPVQCMFIPHRAQDIVEYGLWLRRDGTAVEAKTHIDLEYFEKARDENGGPERPQSDDATFALTAMPADKCRWNRRWWSPKGSTAALRRALP